MGNGIGLDTQELGIHAGLLIPSAELKFSQSSSTSMSGEVPGMEFQQEGTCIERRWFTRQFKISLNK